MAVSKMMTFSWVDYTLFALFLAFSVVIALSSSWLQRCRKAKHKPSSASAAGGSKVTSGARIEDNTSGRETGGDEYFRAEGNINPLAGSMSMIASIVNGIYVLGVPAEIHYGGAVFILNCIGSIMASIGAALIIVRMFVRLNYTSLYEYLEHRYSKTLRLLVAVLNIGFMIIFLAVVLYAPSLAFNQVSGVQVWIIIVVTGLTCCCYSVLGGVRGVIWADALQLIIMIGGMGVLTGIGVVSVGGRGAVDTIVASGRLNLARFSPDPRVRHSVWTQTIGVAVSMFLFHAQSQVLAQRCVVIGNAKKSQAAALLTIPFNVTLAALACTLGLVISAYYFTCDPLESGTIKKPDQVLAQFVMETMASVPGLAGLFIASLFAAALSTVSSFINIMAAIFLEDFFKPVYSRCSTLPLGVTAYQRIAKIATFVFGLIPISVVFFTRFIPNIAVIPLVLINAIVAPIGTVFLLGFFVPFVEQWGATVGLVCGITLNACLNLGNLLYASPIERLPIGRNCSSFNMTYTPGRLLNNSTQTMLADSAPFHGLFDIAYNWYGLIGLCTTTLCALVTSALVRRSHNVTEKDSRLFFPGIIRSKSFSKRNKWVQAPVYYNGAFDDVYLHTKQGSSSKSTNV